MRKIVTLSKYRLTTEMNYYLPFAQKRPFWSICILSDNKFSYRWFFYYINIFFYLLFAFFRLLYLNLGMSKQLYLALTRNVC